MQGIQPLSVQLGASADAWSSLSSAARGVGGLVVQDGDALLIEIMGQRLPLPQGAGLAEARLTAGARVHIDFVQGENGLTLLVRPAGMPDTQPSTPTPAGATTQTFPATQRLIASILDSLGHPLLALQGKESTNSPTLNLIPRSMPLRSDILQQIFALFTRQSQVSGDLKDITRILDDLLRSLPQRTTGAQVLSRATVENASLLTRQLLVSEAPERLLRSLQDRGDQDGRPFEAKLAKLLQSTNDPQEGDIGEALRGDLRAQLSRLRDDAGIREYLRESGQLPKFEQACQRVSERLTGGHLQNLHGLDQQYAYLQIPFTPGDTLHELRLHIFADRDSGGREGFDPSSSSVVMDLETSRLGDLWIELGFAGAICRCRLRATSEAVVNALELAGSELESSLVKAGYTYASVSVGLWTGDRLGAAADMLARFQGMEVEA